MLDRYGDDALRSAFERGLLDGTYGHEYVAHYLTHALASTDSLRATAQPELPL